MVIVDVKEGKATGKQGRIYMKMRFSFVPPLKTRETEGHIFAEIVGRPVFRVLNADAITFCGGNINGI